MTTPKYQETRRDESTLRILEVLSQCEPSRAQLTKREQAADWLSKWGILISAGMTAVGAGLAFCHVQLLPLPEWIQIIAMALSLLAVIVTLLSLAIPIIASAGSLIRWKKSSFLNLKKEFNHDTNYVTQLESFDCHQLEEAKYWIELKISRIESRIGYFFGEKTAAFAMFAIAWSCLKELGGWEWMSETIKSGFALENLGNTLLLWASAFVLGISLGGALLRRVAQHYVYQKELLNTALRKSTRQLVDCPPAE